MFLTQGKPERGRLTPFRYGTAGTTTTTTLASSGGLLINIDSATGDIARNSNGWLENNEALGWYINRAATNVSVEADTAVMLDGHKTLKLTVDASGRVKAFMYDVTGASGYNQKYMKPAKPSTKYKITCKVKTTNVATNSAFLLVEQFNSALGLVTSANTTALTGTNDFTNIVYEVTTSATTSYISINPHLNVAGNASDAWFGVATMTFDEVIEPVANSLTSSSPSLVSFTAVGSTDNIDQSQLTNTSGAILGNTGGTSYLLSQSFTPTKSKLTGVYLMKKANVGTPTGNFKVDIRTDDGTGKPTATILATYTIPLSTYNALTVETEFLVNVPCNLTAGTKYHIVVQNTATETAGNYFYIGQLAVGTYTGGDKINSTDGGAMWAITGSDIYFKTLYYKPTTNFKASQNNSTVSISADEDGFLDGSVINLTTGAFSVPDLIKTKWDGTATFSSYQGLDVRKYLAYQPGFNGAWQAGTSYNIIAPQSATKTAGFIIKFQGLNFKTITTSLVISNVGGTNTAGLAYSYDGTNYTEFRQIIDDTEGNTLVSSTIDVTGHSTVYISVYRVSGSDLRITDYSFSGTVDVSSLSTLRNYPTNKDIIKQYSTTLGSATTSATYRATKWGFPAIEYLPLGVDSTGLIARYDFLGNANDTSGNGYNGTVNGATLTTGRFGDSNSAYSFNGTTDYITASNALVNNQDITVSVDVNVTTNPVAQSVICAGVTTNQFIYKLYYITITGVQYIRLGTTNDSVYTATHTVNLANTGWNNITITKSGTTQQIYLNGLPVGTPGNSTTAVSGLITQQSRIGSNTTGSQYFNGKIGATKVFNRALSDAEVLAMYTDSIPTNQFLDVDTTATGSTVAFSELGTSYTVVADGASLAITSTSTPNIFVKANITANRLYLSSNDYNASSDKDGSLKQSVVYKVVQ